MKKIVVLIALGLGLAAGLTATLSAFDSAVAGTQDCKAKRTC